MKSLVLAQFPMTWLTVSALLLFFVFFCGMVANVMSRKRDQEFTDASRLPLEEGHRHEHN